MTEASRALFAILLATAAAGCSSGGIKNNGDGSTISLSPAPCGGTVTATGTTPAGAFDGTLVSAVYDGCTNGVFVWIGDASSGRYRPPRAGRDRDVVLRSHTDPPSAPIGPPQVARIAM